MKFRIEFVATASKGATGKLKKTANLKLVIRKTGYNREQKFLRHSVKIEEWDKTIDSSNWENYQWLRNSLFEFTKAKYKKDFSPYQLDAITESFLRSYYIYTQEKGIGRMKGSVHLVRVKIKRNKNGEYEGRYIEFKRIFYR